MLMVFAKSAIGAAHVKGDKPCQDFSACYQDGARAIITACDGHGGDIYVRSDEGSKFASMAVMEVFMHLVDDTFAKYNEKEITDKLKLGILCAWNKSVEQSLLDNPLAETTDAVKAYGTTLIGSAVVGGKIICIQIGDGGCFLIKQGELVAAFDYDGDPVANFTYSMCEEDAFSHIKIGIFDLCEYDGVICCTDGLINPYGNLKGFHECFMEPTLNKLREGKAGEVEQFVVDLGLRLGTGDDVSFSLILKPNEKTEG